MNKSEIEKCLIHTLNEVQELSGEAQISIDLRTCPIKDLSGFDSLRGVEATFLLSVKLKCEFKAEKGEVNVFVSEDGRRALRVGEIVDRLTKLVK
jgi:hypothetical protein